MTSERKVGSRTAPTGRRFLSAAMLMALWLGSLGCRAPAGDAAPSASEATAASMSEVPAAAGVAAEARRRPAVEVVFLDVGQGDAVLVRAPGGETALIDAGRGDPVGQLTALGVERIDLLVASHPHADHIGGIDDVLAAFPVRFYMDNAQPHTTATYLDLMRILRARTDITYLEATERTITLGMVRLEVLPLPAVDAVVHNDRSVGLVVRFGDFSVFLSGDSERHEVSHFVERGAVPEVTVLKAAHHGSRNGFTRAFLAAARPEVVVISLGNNSYGHPHAEALDAYASVAGEIYRTDREGRITVLGYDDGSFEVRTER